MKKNRLFLLFALLMALAVTVSCGGGDTSKPIRVGNIADNEHDPAEWGKIYPFHYESWQKTKEPKPANRSKYRKGWDKDRVTYDRLSEYPYQALLYNGWGFGIEYNEPRGHFYMITDQLEIDPSRVAPGGVCLACKSPFHKEFVKSKGEAYLKAPYTKAVDMLPSKHKTLGVACIDCHDNKTMGMRTNKWHILKGMDLIGKKEFNHQDNKMLACSQCHMTYYVPRDKAGKTAGDVIPPWTGAKWGNISIEKIIADLLTDYQREEWTQTVTGFRMPYIRHPEFEFFTKSSVHYNAGVTCIDCHMPYKRVGNMKMTDHDITSPLKTEPEMRACAQCHTESADWLKKQVVTIQDRTSSLLNRAGYQTAVTAKLFELLHKEQKSGKKFDIAPYEKAKKFYKEAFLRVVFVGAENSTGFHNPSEAGRVLGDAIAYGNKSEILIRQMLASGGVKAPEQVNLELSKYLNNRGKKKLMFQRNQEAKDPYGTEDIFTPVNARGY